MRRLRLGMVGGGEGSFIGAVHRIATRLDDRYELVAGAFSSNPERGRTAAAALHVSPDRAYADYRRMAVAEAARTDGIDAVAIVTPNDSHHPIACAFIDAGIAVICDKPMTTNFEDAADLVRRVRQSGQIFVLTHNYSGYPMVRQARGMIAAGALGDIRTVQVEYAQDWLTTRLEDTGNRQAVWRTDPARSGPAGCVGDIGTHAYHLACFVGGLELEAVAADLSTFVEGRRLDDNAQMLLRFRNGARGALWCSQTAPGNENGLRLRIYGSKAGLEWHQEHPNQLRYTVLGEPPQILSRGAGGVMDAATHATRIPAGHPEGYLEAFAQIYSDAADMILSRQSGSTFGPHAALVPDVKDGARGVAFIAATIESNHNDAAWITPTNVNDVI